MNRCDSSAVILRYIRLTSPPKSDQGIPMARVFTTEFRFRQFWLKALVVIQEEEGRLNVRLRVFDPEALRILGKESIAFAGLKGYKASADLQGEEVQELLDTVHDAILDHLNKK